MAVASGRRQELLRGGESIERTCLEHGDDRCCCGHLSRSGSLIELVLFLVRFEVLVVLVLFVRVLLICA